MSSPGRIAREGRPARTSWLKSMSPMRAMPRATTPSNHSAGCEAWPAPPRPRRPAPGRTLREEDPAGWRRRSHGKLDAQVRGGGHPGLVGDGHLIKPPRGASAMLCASYGSGWRAGTPAGRRLRHARRRPSGSHDGRGAAGPPAERRELRRRPGGVDLRRNRGRPGERAAGWRCVQTWCSWVVDQGDTTSLRDYAARATEGALVAGLTTSSWPNSASKPPRGGRSSVDEGRVVHGVERPEGHGAHPGVVDSQPATAPAVEPRAWRRHLGHGVIHDPMIMSKRNSSPSPMLPSPHWTENIWRAMFHMPGFW